MRCIEVKLKGETRRVEFDQDIKFVECVGQKFFCTKNFWIGLFIGICTPLLYVWNLPTYNTVTHRTISVPAIIDMQKHGLSWHHKNSRWEKKEDSPDFPILDIE